jgi:NADH-quinone oxidoreductase subunit N
MASKICKREKKEDEKKIKKFMINWEKYCSISTSHVSFVFLIIIIRIIYLGMVGRLSYELGFFGLIVVSISIWLWDRCLHCPTCWFSTWFCSAIHHITAGWHEPLSIYSTEYINFELIKISNPYYWEFFFKSTLIPHMAEINLGIGIMLLILYFTWLDYKKNHEKNLSILVAKFLIVIYIYYMILLNVCFSQSAVFIGQMLMNTTFILFVKHIMLISLIICIVVSFGYIRKERIHNFEYYLLVALASIGMITVISANDLMVFYIGIEIQSLAFYVLAGLKMYNNFSTEAAVKYFILGAFSSGLLLLGSSFIYGAIGTTNFSTIMLMLSEPYEVVNLKSLIFGIMLVMVSILFKLGAAPFHAWLPDVYEGSPTIVTMIYSIVPKIAIIGFVVRLNLNILNTNVFFINDIWIPAAILSIVIGTLGGLFQAKIKRLIAYSAISHIGFMIIGLATSTSLSIFALFFYIITYIIISINIFTFLLVVRKVDNNLKIKKINELVILFKSHPFLAWNFCFILFSIAGIPPLLGFYSKLYIFIAALKYGYYIVAIIAAVFSVIACAYYIRLIRLLYFKEISYWALYVEISKTEAMVLIGTLFLNLFFFVRPDIFVSMLYNLILCLTY